MKDSWQRTNSCLKIAIVAVVLVIASDRRVGADRVIQSAMDNDPKLSIPGVTYGFAPGLKELWLKALAQPEADLQRQSADAIARAHSLGMKELQDTAPELLKIFQAEKTNSVVRLAIARALITIDARNSAPVLFQHLDKAGVEYAVIVEPALGRWNFRPIRKRWIARLSDRRSRRTLVRLAIRGLTAAREREASTHLWNLASDSQTAGIIRVEAATALGEIETTGLLMRATRLSKDQSPRGMIDRLVAVRLLTRHQGAKVEDLLSILAADPQPAVARVATQRLMTLNPGRVRKIAGVLLQRKDSNLRRLACESLATSPTVSSAKLLIPILSDHHPAIRNLARAVLHKFADSPELASVIQTETMQLVGGDNWRGHEQGSLLLAQLDYKPAAKRLVELLESERPEVMEAAAWALRKLAVREILPAMLDKARRQTARDRKVLMPDPNSFPDAMTAEMGRTAQLVQLYQAFGQMRYKPAIPLLQKMVPKSDFYMEESRAAAVWALGFLVTGQEAKRLSKTLAGRLADVVAIPPETTRVRWMSAIALGRLKSREQLPVLQEFYRSEGTQSGVGLACHWAIGEIMGKSLPEPQPRKKTIVGWFVEPVSKP